MSAPSLDHLRTFVTVFRAGSQTKAAELLGISQPTVSAHLAALEQALGFTVFVRTPTGVEATPKGAELAREVAEHLDALEDSVLLSGLGLGLGQGAASSRALHIGGPAELLSEVDRKALAGGLADYLAASSRHAVSAGIAGWREDDLAFLADWGFRLDDMRVPVSIWQGDQDRMVPADHGRWLAEHVAGAETHLLPGEGHISLVNAFPTVLDSLLANAAD